MDSRETGEDKLKSGCLIGFAAISVSNMPEPIRSYIYGAFGVFGIVVIGRAIIHKRQQNKK